MKAAATLGAEFVLQSRYKIVGESLIGVPTPVKVNAMSAVRMTPIAANKICTSEIAAITPAAAKMKHWEPVNDYAYGVARFSFFLPICP